MNNKLVAALIITACGLAILAGCAKNKPPEITVFTANPADTMVLMGTTVTFQVVAIDPEDDKLSYEWLASGGEITDHGADTAVWLAPDTAQSCTVTVRVSDGKNTVDTSKAISTRGFYEGSASAYTQDSVYLPNNDTTEIPFTWDASDTLMPGALVDSVEITLDFDSPDADSLELEDFTLNLVSPAGTQVLLYDGINLTTLDLSLSDVFGFENEPVDGLWRLVFVRNNPTGYNAWVGDCDLNIDYKY